MILRINYLVRWSRKGRKSGQKVFDDALELQYIAVYEQLNTGE
jgi:hypothetical protein